MRCGQCPGAGGLKKIINESKAVLHFSWCVHGGGGWISKKQKSGLWIPRAAGSQSLINISTVRVHASGCTALANPGGDACINFWCTAVMTRGRGSGFSQMKRDLPNGSLFAPFSQLQGLIYVQGDDLHRGVSVRCKFGVVSVCWAVKPSTFASLLLFLALSLGLAAS